MDNDRTLAILAAAAKYDVSCASSGAVARSCHTPSPDGRGLGSTRPGGICHSFTPDGRCISLLKILLTNQCRFDCGYCVNRAGADTPRAAFTPEQAARLTMAFYKRNYIEGLFLSTAVPGHFDDAMEGLVRVVRTLREKHAFRGYIHLKVIAGADPRLVRQAGRHADRLSANVELPSDAALRTVAPGKCLAAVRRAMGDMRRDILAGRDRGALPFAPAGQSTQMIVGAESSTDAAILRAASGLYGAYGLKRVYYSAYTPVDGAARGLPTGPPELLREHRLYQADWLLRFYGFSVGEITDTGAMLDPALDPKLAWALRNRAFFPVDVNRAERSRLLRVPGLGARSVARILRARRMHRLRIDDLSKLGVRLKTCRPFLAAADYTPAPRLLESAGLREMFLPDPRQLSLFDGQVPAENNRAA
jgi:putative DNA modification/repair radical SAM protein